MDIYIQSILHLPELLIDCRFASLNSVSFTSLKSGFPAIFTSRDYHMWAAVTSFKLDCGWMFKKSWMFCKKLNVELCKKLNVELRKKLNVELRKKLNVQLCKKLNVELRKKLNAELRKKLNVELCKSWMFNCVKSSIVCKKLNVQLWKVECCIENVNKIHKLGSQIENLNFGGNITPYITSMATQSFLC
jgi:hypothetical protein